MDPRLKELQHITQMVFDIESAILRKLAIDTQKQAAQINAINTDEAKRADSLAIKGGRDLALYAGADLRWSNWKQKEIRKLNIQRSALLAKHEEQRQTTQSAFGKKQAITKLLETMANEAKIISHRIR